MRLFFFYTFAFLALSFFSPTARAQDNDQPAPTKIKLLNADQLLYDANVLKARKLIGNVKFKHNGAIMECDSAYMFTEENRINAYSNVKVNQGDSVFLYGDSLKYSGDTRIAKLRGNIRLIDPQQTLTTSVLDYDMNKKAAFYSGGGSIESTDSSSTLSSEIGYYYTESKTFFFKNDVCVVSPDYTIIADTLEYNSALEKTFFHGPTTITSDSNTVYCENGWYDQANNLAKFTCNAEILSKEQRLRGDSIYYNQNTGIGEVFRDVEILDTTNSIQVFGDYATYNESDSSSLITGNIELIQFFDADSLFLHADTLFTDYDSTRKHRQMFAYHHVKFFKTDLQGKCDSMVFLNADSSVFMYNEPVIWSDANQMTGDTVKLRTYDGEIEYMRLFENAFIISKEDSIDKFNQIKGRELIAHFNDSNEVYKINVNGNGQTIYYGKEEDGTYMGMNRLDCSEMKIMMNDNQIQDITFYVSPVGVFEPMKDVKPENQKLRNFIWLEYLQPKSREDIFVWITEPPAQETEKATEDVESVPTEKKIDAEEDFKEDAEQKTQEESKID